MSELVSALCLVAVLEGLFLFAAPRAWRQTMEQLVQRPEGVLRRFGLVLLAAGLVALWVVRQG